jgi:hypothetical protein
MTHLTYPVKRHENGNERHRQTFLVTVGDITKTPEI